MGTPILFSPDNVRNVLGRLPSVAALLPNPAVEGEPSDAFPGVLRKTEREVYRWIANTHYDHLADAVLYLERVHAAGCTFALANTGPVPDMSKRLRPAMSPPRE